MVGLSSLFDIARSALVTWHLLSLRAVAIALRGTFRDVSSDR